MHASHPHLPEGLIRKMWRVEASRYRDHLLRLDKDSRRCRFGGAVSDEYVIRFAELAVSADTVIHGFFVNGTMRGAAELRAIGSAQLRQAEAALSIEKAWQDRGIGSALLARTLHAARKRGIKFLHMACLAENQRMQRLARKFDAQLKVDFGTAIGAIRAPWPTPLAFMREAIGDGHRLARAILDVQAQILQSA